VPDVERGAPDMRPNREIRGGGGKKRESKRKRKRKVRLVGI
jgi:hypothetical protein